MNASTKTKRILPWTGAVALAAIFACTAWAAPVPGGTLDPLTIPKYVTPLVIPPVMPTNGAGADSYDIAVRQFRQQILPAGYPSTQVWSYGDASDPTPAVAPDPASTFNYPAYTVETTANVGVNVRWVNQLMDPAGNFLPHFLPIDQALHWANPDGKDCVHGGPTDCSTSKDAPYPGPVPMVPHVHGAHVDGHSDGYPEAWFLPAAANIDCKETAADDTPDPADDYYCSGTMFDDATGAKSGIEGYVDYYYRNDQPATTIWYHDHSLGITRVNVYAGPAGFWLIRGGDYDAALNGVTGGAAVLPGPAPVAGDTVLALNVPGDPVRNAIREIPVVIQDRSFNADGELFYPDDRSFFEGVNPKGGPAPSLEIPFVPDTASDIAKTWNPEAFFNTMVVNGVTWPKMEVAPALYRVRFLNGCNSRFLNLSLYRVQINRKGERLNKEFSFYQIGAEQGFLPQVIEVRTGFATALPGDGTIPANPTRAAAKDQALLMGPAERADVLIDFRGLKDGTILRVLNTAPDAPFGGFPDIPADPATTGQVMQFVVNSALSKPADATFTDPYALQMTAEPAIAAAAGKVQSISLNEGESELVCVDFLPDGTIVDVPGSDPVGGVCTNGGVPFAPKEALLGTVQFDAAGLPIGGVPLKWTDHTNTSFPAQVTMQDGSTVNIMVTENPKVGETQQWDIYNFTMDAHPIHLHLVRFEVVGRTLMDGVTPSPNGSLQPWETGFKDTVIAYPGEITSIKATFDVPGLYVWHCHILEHEDNEMMRPYVVSP